MLLSRLYRDDDRWHCVCFFLFCVSYRRCPTKSTFRPPRNSQMRTGRLSFGLKLPPRSSMMTRQPPSHRHRPPPMPNDAAPDAQRSRRQRGGRKVQRRRRNKAARQAAAAAAATLTKPATTSQVDQPRRQRNRRRRDPPPVIYRWGSDMSGRSYTGSRRDWWTSWMSTLIRTSSPVRRARRSMSRARQYVMPARRPSRGPFNFFVTPLPLKRNSMSTRRCQEPDHTAWSPEWTHWSCSSIGWGAMTSLTRRW